VDEYTELLQDSPGHTCLITADATVNSPSVSWLVSTGPGRFTVLAYGADGK